MTKNVGAPHHLLYARSVVAFTRPLLPLGPNQSVCLEDGKPAVPQRFFGVSSQEYWSVTVDFLVNLGDLVGTLGEAAFPEYLVKSPDFNSYSYQERGKTFRSALGYAG